MVPAILLLRGRVGLVHVVPLGDHTTLALTEELRNNTHPYLPASLGRRNDTSQRERKHFDYHYYHRGPLATVLLAGAVVHMLLLTRFCVTPDNDVFFAPDGWFTRFGAMILASTRPRTCLVSESYRERMQKSSLWSQCGLTARTSRAARTRQ